MLQLFEEGVVGFYYRPVKLSSQQLVCEDTLFRWKRGLAQVSDIGSPHQERQIDLNSNVAQLISQSGGWDHQ